MQDANSSRLRSYSTLTGLTYIDSLISGATLMGLYSITIEDLIITDAMVTELRSLGYNVLKHEPRDYAGQLYTRYIIDWTPVTPTPTVSLSRTPSATPSATPTVTPSLSLPATPSVTPSMTPTLSITPSATPSATPSITPTITVSNSIPATPSVTPSVTPTITVSNSISATPSVTPSVTPSETPSVTPSISLSLTPSVTPSITPSLTPSLTPTPSILPNVFINNVSGAYNITGVTVSGVTVSGVSFPVLPGESKSGFTTKGFTGVTIIVDLSANSTGECLNIDGVANTTTGVKTYSNTNGSSNAITIQYESGPCV